MMHDQVKTLATDAISNGIPAELAAVQDFLTQRRVNPNDVRRFAHDVMGEMEAQASQRPGSYEGGSAHP